MPSAIFHLFNLIPNLLLYDQNYYSYVGLKNSTQKSAF